MPTLHRYQDGVCDETGTLIAVQTRGWWYTPGSTKQGFPEFEACSAVQCAQYDAMPITARKVQYVLVPKPPKPPKRKVPRYRVY